jgi:hypothetical protein
MKISKAMAFVVIASAVTLGVGSNVAQHFVEQNAASEHASVVQRIDAQKLNSMYFQSRCGSSGIRMLDKKDRSFVLTYVNGNMTVIYTAKNAKDFAWHDWNRVVFLQSKPLHEMTVEQVVDRLGCK